MDLKMDTEMTNECYLIKLNSYRKFWIIQNIIQFRCDPKNITCIVPFGFIQ